MLHFYSGRPLQNLSGVDTVAIVRNAVARYLVGGRPCTHHSKGHLLIEAALVDICSRLLVNPAALEKGRVNFLTRVNLVQALLDDGEVPEDIWHALRGLNSLRNALAHNLEPEDIEAQLCKFVKGLEEFDKNLRVLHDEMSIPERLRGSIIYLSGLLSHVSEPPDETGGDG